MALDRQARCQRELLIGRHEVSKRKTMQPNSSTATANRSDLRAVELARELRLPLDELARVSGQSPARIVNLALSEYLERRLRPDRDSRGSTSSYVEMTAREALHDFF